MRKGLLTKVKRIEQQRARAAASALPPVCPECSHLTHAPGLAPGGSALLVGMAEQDYLVCKLCGVSYMIEHQGGDAGVVVLSATPAPIPFI